MNKTQIQLRQ